MSNTIATRVYDFLKQYPPFSLVPPSLLMDISGKVEIKYGKPKDIIFRQGEYPKRFIYIVQQGAVHLLRDDDEERLLIDECDEGDVFGIRPLIAEEPYALTAMIAEESIIYAVPIGGFENEIRSNPDVLYYLAQNFAAGVRNRQDVNNRGRIFLEKGKLVDGNFKLVEVQTMESSKKPVTCAPTTAIKNAAVIMSDNEVGSIVVVDENKKPLGMMTDKDLRKRVVTGLVPIDAMVESIMTTPVVTIAPNVAVADVQILMLKHKIHHLCVTEDGTTQSSVVGVISEHDLLVIQGNNPAILVREIARAQHAADLQKLRVRAEYLLRKYIYQEVSIAFISTVMTEINDAIIQRAIQMAIETLSQEGIQLPDVNWAWMALGSEGRSEQLLRTDQDNALIFEDVPEADFEAVKSVFLQLSTEVTRILFNVGFDYCPGNMMASNPDWCSSASKWKGIFSDWIFNPNEQSLLNASIFFDYRNVYGAIHLTQNLTEHIHECLEQQHIFLAFLAKNALQNPPPLSFFRNFVVEKGGEHKDAFDIKKRAMMPLADAARVLVLENRIANVNNTFRRFEKLAELEPQNADLYQSAADAYEILIRYRTLQGLKNKDTGRFFKPDELNKMERLNLRNSFQPIEDLQSLLTLRFQLNYFR